MDAIVDSRNIKDSMDDDLGSVCVRCKKEMPPQYFGWLLICRDCERTCVSEDYTKVEFKDVNHNPFVTNNFALVNNVISNPFVARINNTISNPVVRNKFRRVTNAIEIVVDDESEDDMEVLFDRLA